MVTIASPLGVSRHILTIKPSNNADLGKIAVSTETLAYLVRKRKIFPGGVDA